jgi:cell division protein FtsZ
MTLKINIPEPDLLKPRISIFGVGGAGGNALNNMIRSNLEGVEFIAANTDAQSLQNSLAANRIQLGAELTKGLGAGSFPDKGRAAAEENIDEIAKYLDGNNMIFITAGMGGGTGTGAAPVIAKLAREREILTVGVVTKPFHFEGKYRMEAAEVGIEELKKYVDTLIVIPNQNLFRIANEQTTFESAFKMADNVLHAGVRGVTDLITMPGLVNLDFADIRTVMTKMGKALMGTGEAEGDNRAIAACEEAISNPLLDDVSIKGAKGVLVNMTGGPDMTLFEADLAVNTIKKEVDANANIIFGSAFNENMNGKIRISVVATGIEDDNSFKFGQTDEIKTKSQMVYEVKNNDEKQEKEVINIATQGKKTFFDPGVINEPIESSSKITKNDFFKPNFKEPNLDLDDNENSKEDKNFFKEESVNISFEEKSFESESFEDNSANQGDIFDKASNAIEKLEKQVQEKSKKPSKAKDKKEGFSLFGFMNSGKSSNIDDEKHHKKTQSSKELKEQEKAKLNKQSIIIEDDEEALEVHKKPGKKNEDGFWSDEKINKAPDEGDFSSGETDDILNVPAFFRRKK